MLKKTPLAETFDFVQHNNWQSILGEVNPEDLLRDAAKADVFLYQPSGPIKNLDISTEEITERIVPKSAVKLSYAYNFNSGFFPIVLHGGWHTSHEVIEKATRGIDVVSLYDEDRLFYDCARRFAENLAEQSRREETCELKFAPYILQNFQREHLFLVCNHPTSTLFAHMARTVLTAMGEDSGPIPIVHPNEANLPGWHPIHPAVIRELGLQYRIAEPEADHQWYRHLMKTIMEKRGAP